MEEERPDDAAFATPAAALATAAAAASANGASEISLLLSSVLGVDRGVGKEAATAAKGLVQGDAEVA